MGRDICRIGCCLCMRCGSFLWRLSEIICDGFPKSLVMASWRAVRICGRYSNARAFSLNTR